MIVNRAPEFLQMTAVTTFLAGPIQGTWNWQEEMIKRFVSALSMRSFDREIIVASQRRLDVPESRKKDFTDEMYNKQVDWETYNLNRAAANGLIVFWCAKETIHDCGRAYAQTTRAELFEWKVKHERDGTKLIVGIEPGFTGEKYIRRRFSQDCPNVYIYNSFDRTCSAAINETIAETVK